MTITPLYILSGSSSYINKKRNNGCYDNNNIYSDAIVDLQSVLPEPLVDSVRSIGIGMIIGIISMVTMIIVLDLAAPRSPTTLDADGGKVLYKIAGSSAHMALSPEGAR